MQIGRKYYALIVITSMSLGMAAEANFGFCRELVKPFFSTNRAKLALQKIVAKAGVRVNGSRAFDIQVRDERFYQRVLGDANLELGNTYMDGYWDAPAIDELVTKLYSLQQQNGAVKTFAPLWRVPGLALQGFVKNGYRYLRDAFTNRQTAKRSAKVNKEHYDIGNRLYRMMLDPTMTYTSGVWRAVKNFTLEDAQNTKYDLLARKLDLRPGQHVLDIGSGFGGFARFAAKHYGVRVTGITISNEQLKVARALSAGIAGVNFQFSDYRDIAHRFAEESFDHVVSIEMIEAVGPKNLAEYFAAASARLKDGGRFVIQAIANNSDVVNTNAWFSEHIFHDGVAPSTNQVDRAAARYFGAPVDRHRITGDYDKTLMQWQKNFQAAWPELQEQYGGKFKRMWDFYLLSVAGAFRSRELQLDQTIFIKGATAQARRIPIVRALAPAQEMRALRATAEERAALKEVLQNVDTETKFVKDALLTGQRAKRGKALRPLAKNARLAIIGAGPGGLSAAHRLRELGHTNITVFEKEANAGGKSHTVDFAGRPHDLGATMGVPLKYKQIVKFANAEKQATINFPKEVQYDLSRGGAALAPSTWDNIKLKYQGLRYLLYRITLQGFGQRSLEVPAMELSDPFDVLLKRRGLGEFAKSLKSYLIGYGYGGPTTPAVFAARMFDSNAILGAALGRQIMWKNGTQPIWQGLASTLNIKVRAPVKNILRTPEGVQINLAGESQPLSFDKVILAIDPKQALKILDASSEEKSVYAHMRTMPYATFAVRMTGLAENTAEVGYLRENMTLERMGSPMAWIKRYPDDNLFIFHLFAPEKFSDQQIMQKISTDMQRLGARNIVLEDSRRWDFFPHVDALAMRESFFYRRANNLQGQNNTVFVNEALGMSTMPDAVELGRKVAERLASGEY